MARTTPGVTRQRILDEALRLFARDGYASTSVAGIQRACGLRPGSGALYKHFPSKRALLEAAVQRNLDTTAARHTETVATAPDEPRAAMALMLDAAWAVLDDDRELVRVMVREFDTFPDLFEGMWQGVLAGVYRACTEWIRGRCAAGCCAVGDPEATAAVLVASLTYHPILDTLIGHTPGDVDRERFRAAWLDHAVATLSRS